MAKRFYGFRDNYDVSQMFSDILHGTNWRRLPYDVAARPTYVHLTDGMVCTVTKNGKLRTLKQTPDDSGYLTVKLKQADGSYKTTKVHRLVMMFVYNPKPDEYSQVDHLRSKQNNGVDDLEWVSPQMNIQRAYERRRAARATE